MKTITRLTTLAGAVALAMGSAAWAANTANQTVTYEVQEVDDITVSGNPAKMTVTAATPGSAPTEVTDSSTTWAITSNKGTDAKKLMAVLNTDMPDDVTLKINVTGPAGSSGGTDVTLSDEAAAVVTGIDQVDEAALGITYKLSATVDAGVVSEATKTVTLTLTDS